ncbi:MAG: hypothetical protein ACREBU_11610 [Nitrososphaera sp.]
MLKWKDIERYVPFTTGRVRVQHYSDSCQPNSASRGLHIERKPNGTIFAYCFRCGASLHHRDFSVVFRRAAGVPRHDDKSIARLPVDLDGSIDHWDSAARIWIARARITQKHCDRYGIGYSPSAQRLAIPIRKDGELVGSVQRGFGDGPKYLRFGRGFPFVAKSDSSVMPLTLIVEDCLSAIRGADVGVSAIALLGTKLSEEALLALMGREPYIVWLDDDNPQVKQAQGQISQRLRQFGGVHVVRGKREPKLLSDGEIRGVIS